jgi:hypothetical protein
MSNRLGGKAVPAVHKESPDKYGANLILGLDSLTKPLLSRPGR